MDINGRNVNIPISDIEYVALCNNVTQYYIKQTIEHYEKQSLEGGSQSIVVVSRVKLAAIRPKELARILGLTYNVVFRLVSFGKVEYEKVGGKIWIDILSVRKYLASTGDTEKLRRLSKIVETFYILMDETIDAEYRLGRDENI